jgi:hypothetical protein
MVVVVNTDFSSASSRFEKGARFLESLVSRWGLAFRERRDGRFFYTRAKDWRSCDVKYAPTR